MSIHPVSLSSSVFVYRKLLRSRVKYLMSASIGDAVYCPICVIWITLNPHVIELNLTWI